MIVKDIVSAIEEVANPALQESYDNAGLIIGSPVNEVSAVLLTVDVTEQVIDEAIERNTNLVISHHPVIFEGMKRITGKNYVERIVLKAIQNNINLYAVHTNIDAIDSGVNNKIASKLGLDQTRVLSPVNDLLCKLVTFIPASHDEKVKKAVFEAGAGHIGNYDYCGFSLKGTGSFRGDDNTNPFLGQKGIVNFEEELRFETVFPVYKQDEIINALVNAHPYEEVAYDIYPLKNSFEKIGMGMIGELNEPLREEIFLGKLKETFKTGCIRHTGLRGKDIKKVAICGGSGSFLINKAIRQGADIFVTADVKYHQFFDADGKIIVADIGHYESEQFTTEIFYDILIKKFSNFAVYFSKINTNPIKYY